MLYFQVFLFDKISIYQIFVVIYQLDVGSEYQQLEFHIFCKKITIMTKKSKKVNIQKKKYQIEQ
jgi:hypothetical protein